MQKGQGVERGEAEGEEEEEMEKRKGRKSKMGKRERKGEGEKGRKGRGGGGGEGLVYERDSKTVEFVIIPKAPSLLIALPRAKLCLGAMCRIRSERRAAK